MISKKKRGPTREPRHRFCLRRAASVGRDCLGLFLDGNETPFGALVVELHETIAQGEEREVVTHTHVVTRVELSAALAHEDVASENELAVEALDSEALGVAVAPVAGAAYAFLMCHVLYLPRSLSRRSSRG